MDDSLVTLDELQARCDWEFDSDEDRAAPGYLEEASDLVRAYGRNWSAANAPRLCKNIVISAVRRYMRNPEGFIQSRAGDETLAWRDAGEDTATITLTQQEIKLIRSLAGGTGLKTVPTQAWSPQRSGPDIGYRPVSGYPGEKPFPYYADRLHPW